jgi:hypothetical protein
MVFRGEPEVVRLRGARAFGLVSRTPGRLRDPALPVLRPVCEELADGWVRSPRLTSAARRPESIISVMPATPHVERREAGVSRQTRATLRTRGIFGCAARRSAPLITMRSR